jgi:hypothetical protein
MPGPGAIASRMAAPRKTKSRVESTMIRGLYQVLTLFSDGVRSCLAYPAPAPSLTAEADTARVRAHSRNPPNLLGTRN